jgi:hypothetical protein
MVLSRFPMDYVSEEAKKVVEYIESRLRILPPAAGILFISVKAVPAPKGEVKAYEVRMGISKNFDEETGMAVIKTVFHKEIEEGAFTLLASVFRGIPGAANDKSHEGAHPRPS